MGGRQGRRWRAAGALAAALVVGYGAAILLPGAHDAAHRLERIGPVYLAAGLLLELAALFTYSLLTRTVVPVGHRPPLSVLFRIDLTSLGASHVLPGGAATAATFRFGLLIAAGVRPADTLFVATVQGIGSAIVLNLLLWAALVISVPTHGGDPLYVVTAALGAVLMLAVGVAVIGVTRGQDQVIRALRAVAARTSRIDPDRIERVIRREATRLRDFGTDRRRLVTAVSWAGANWLLDAASLWVFVAAFGHHTPPALLLIAFGLANVLAVLPVTPGGLGVVEGVLIPVLVGFGTPAGTAILGVLSWRLASFWLPIPVSGLAYLSLRMGPLRRREQPPDPAPAGRMVPPGG
ncbi:lysylphosphatidylglycerol synthase transmembrane domain-containing protein [Pseudonocardia acidicola]|uniref:Flippase-like domain-containing protein n=1 Tax=Pseudonocardia acidicola TaxID=2724939 RepID=A0ABX1SCL0_9PSEU|nr:YbhN family protein [Pseudonocardia acidicola]NMH99311.1 flippase-like domain-containing protein [Pseudonocardia acidicola]